ncbi:hypothetical protein ARMGADRAFT_1076027 [Armillaria gallica]|uniref:Uncharacterized protein n=1 Tax=Armillaria gallica TaxID=47427 RepID=A0A2H3DU16_ARMGA|nr:hypothetical protein ARMGADRAFT_1076027 [Armillaria gallica]
MLLLGRDFHVAEMESAEVTTELSFSVQRSIIERRIEKGKGKTTERPMDEGILGQKRKKPKRPETGKLTEGVTAAPETGTGHVNQKHTEPPPKVKQEELSSTNVYLNDFKNMIAMQRIRISQMREGIAPTVPNQGIVFNEKGSAWFRSQVLGDRNQDRSPGVPLPPPPDNGPDDEDNGDDDRDKDDKSQREGNCRNKGRCPNDGEESTPGDDPFIPTTPMRELSAITPRRSMETKALFTEHKFQQIMEFIRANLGMKIMIPDGLKPSRVDSKSMTKYDGTASRETFWEWLRSVVFTYRAAHLGGLERDEERVLILDTMLAGMAKSWFQRRISRLGEHRPSFMDIVLELYKRFIHDSALQDARAAFKAASWEDTDMTVQGWSELLCQLVDDMDVPPNEYSTKEKLMMGLPGYLRSRIFGDKMSIEYNSLEELLQSALDVEYAVHISKTQNWSFRAWSFLATFLPLSLG